MDLPDLPVECLSHIISYISDPITLRSLLVVNKTISEITCKNVVSIDHGNVDFLCRFQRLIIVRETVLIQSKDDIERLARLPKLRSASFRLTPTYFQRAGGQEMADAMMAKTIEIQDQLGVLGILTSQILKDELAKIYVPYFNQATNTFLQISGPIYERTDDPEFSFEATIGDAPIRTFISNHQCLIHISDGIRTIDLKIDVDAMRNGHAMKDAITIQVDSIPFNLNI